MLETYKATLRGDKIEWNGETPDIAGEQSEIEIFLTVLSRNAKTQKSHPFGLGKGEFIVPEIFGHADARSRFS